MTSQKLGSTAGVVARAHQDVWVDDINANAAAITVETSARISADSTESATRIAGDAASISAVAAEVTARIAGDTAVNARVDGVVAGIATLPDLDAAIANGDPSRPGDAPHLWSTQTVGLPESRPTLSGASVVDASLGRVAQLLGEGALAPCQSWRLLPGRKYQVTWSYRRAQDTLDDAGAAVRCGLSWMLGTHSAHGTPTTIADTQSVAVGDNVKTITKVVSSASGSGVDVVAPGGAVYFTPYWQPQGGDTASRLEYIRVVDITDLGGYSPDLTSLSARVTTQESIDAAARLTALEAGAVSPVISPYATRAAAAAATVPVSSSHVQVDAWAAGFPSCRAVWERLGGAPAHTAYFQDDSGAYFGLAESVVQLEMLGGKGDLTNDDTAAKDAALSLGRMVLTNPGRTYRVTTWANPNGVQFIGQGSIQIAYNDGTGTVYKQVAPFYSDRIGFGAHKEYLKRAYDYINLGQQLVIDMHGDSTVYGVSATAPDIILAKIFQRIGYGNVSVINNGVSGTSWQDLFATTATVTTTIASPGVVAWTSHGLTAGDEVVFTTTGALPTGLTAGTSYYVKTVSDSGHFTVAATVGGAAINTSGTQSGTHTATAYHLPDFSTGSGHPQLLVLKYGINDGAQDAADATILGTQMRKKLAQIRTVYDVGALAILVVGPNSTSDNRNNRDARWYEKLRAIYLEACRDYQAAYFDAYAYLQDATVASQQWEDDTVAPGSHRGVHPLDNMNSWLWGGVVDYCFGRGEMTLYRQNQIINLGGSFSNLLPAAAPSTFLTGYSHHRATTGNGWFEDGSVITERNVDSVCVQRLIVYAAGRTRMYVRTANVGSDTWNRWTGAFENITLANSWINYGGLLATAQAAISADGIVTVKGTIKNGTATAGTVVGTLPAGMWPAEDYLFVVNLYSAIGFGRAQASDGTIRVENATWSPTSAVSINCSFKAA